MKGTICVFVISATLSFAGLYILGALGAAFINLDLVYLSVYEWSTTGRFVFFVIWCLCWAYPTIEYAAGDLL